MKSSRGCYFSLAFTIGSFGMAWGSLMSFSPADRISLQRGAFLSSMGIVYFSSLTHFFNAFLLETSNGLKIRKRFRLKFSDVLDITNRLVSATQALFSSLAGVIVCRYSCAKSFLYGNHYMSEAYAWFGAAYFFYDMWSMYKVHAALTAQKVADKLSQVPGTSKLKKLNGGDGGNGKMYENGGHRKAEESNDSDKQVFVYDGNANTSGTGFAKYILSNPIMTIHHIFIGSFGLAVITYLKGGIGDCMFSHFYMMELSTPFVSFRSILSRMNMKNSKIYVINGLLMIGTFFVFRVLLLPYLFYAYSTFANISLWQAITTIPRVSKISIGILFIPQYYWFYLMMLGATKVFFKKSPKSKQHNSDKDHTTSNIISNNENCSTNNNKSEQSRSLL